MSFSFIPSLAIDPLKHDSNNNKKQESKKKKTKQKNPEKQKKKQNNKITKLTIQQRHLKET